ncbi:MAG: polyphosphate kinase 1 [Actinobacteria bacterium]|nr:polyphosphate kinase 1 [Actinomycetota bacterium]MBV8598452.1 polyphosphate kinase 1 [Actinomycetota bacterium]
MATTQRPQFEARRDTLLNRELSWLDLNARVLDLASDASQPLLERVKFCAIFSSNLDEFFMVRVAGLLDQLAAGVAVVSPDGRAPQQTLAEIRDRVLELTAAQSDLWKRELCPALADVGILIGTVDDASESDLAELETTFANRIYPVLTPLAVGPGQPFPYISGLSLSLGLLVRDTESGEERFARVKVPEGLPRFVSIGERGLLIPLENVIAHYLDWLFPEMEIAERAAFRVTRDGDTEISDDADDLLVAVESELQKRRFGAVVRLEVSQSISSGMLARLEERLPARPEHVYPIHGILDLADLSQLYELDRPELKDKPWVPVTQRRLSSPRDGSIFAEIAARDIVVQHPYDSFATSVESFVRAAAKDPNVVTLKTTVYRTSHDSALAPALIEAAENGKQSVCVVELKARFDERRNIEWARSLEQAGVHVVYGFPDMKIHAKTTLVVRREKDGLRRYVHVGTGNYHATTARIYEDIGLFTADPDITADVADLFNFVTGFGRPRRFRKILVAPFTLRRRLVEEIRKVAAAAAAGQRARIRIKVNNLVDPTIIEELYAASQAGAQIDIVVRAICALRPGVPGLSENIHVRSILGRFLEHSRVFCFEAGDEKLYLLGSADLMQRNLDHRIEVLVPVEAPHVRAEIEAVFRTLLADTAQSWMLHADGNWEPPRHEAGHARPAQEAFMRKRERARWSPRRR